MSQFVLWGVSYYLIGIFGPAMERDTQWSMPFIYGGFSAALLAMAVVSPWAGKAIDRHGGARVMAIGAGLIALACAGLALSRSQPVYYAIWLLMGVAMRLTLYDAAFAALARRGGIESRRAMSQVTLFGGLASSAFWPLGSFLEIQFGWRNGVLVYGAIALAMGGLLLTLHPERPIAAKREASDTTVTGKVRSNAGWMESTLYAAIIAFVAFLNSAMSSHMIVLLTGLGMGFASAVWIASLRGIGQTIGRLCEIAFAKTLNPLHLNVLATLLLPLGFLSLALGGGHLFAGIAFAFLYGVGNGVATITRGSMPLVLFGAQGYGTLVGRLLVPSFVLSAAAPLVVAETTERFGSNGAVMLSLVVSCFALAASLALAWRVRQRSSSA